MTAAKNAADALGQVLYEYALVTERINKLVVLWDDARLADQPHGQINHPAWTLGHLAVVMDRGCVLAGGAQILDESWAKRFGQGSKPTANRADYPGRQQLLEKFNSQCQRLLAQLRSSPADVLTAENLFERARPRFPQSGQMLIHMLTAEPGYHLGQMTGWARAMNLPVTF